MHHMRFSNEARGKKKNSFSFFLSNTHKRVRSEDIYELNVLHNRIQYVAVVIKKVLLS